MAPDSTDLDVNGIRMRVQQSGAGPALIFLHGWMLDHRMWKHQIRTLSSHFQVIAPDRRGFGKSTGIPDLAREPDDIAALMQTLGLERAALCAASQAGRVALRFALARPGKIRALVLQGSALDGMPEPADDPGFVPFGAYARLVQSGAMEEFHRQWRSHPFMALPGRSSDLRSELEAMLRDSPCLDLRQAGVTHPGATLDIMTSLPTIASPTLIIAGAEETPHRKAIAHTLRQKIPGASFAEIAGGGHLINMIEPEAYNATLSQFINNLPP